MNNANWICHRWWWSLAHAGHTEIVPVVAGGMDDPDMWQDHFRHVNDDGDAATATLATAEDTNWTQATDTNFRVRFVISADLAQIASTAGYRLQYNLKGAGWNNVTTTSSVIRAFNSSDGGFVDDDVIGSNQRLSDGSRGGSYTATVEDENGVATPGAVMNDNDWGEFDYCIQIRSADVSASDTIDLRVRVENDTIGNYFYTKTPTITVAGGGSTGHVGWMGLTGVGI